MFIWCLLIQDYKAMLSGYSSNVISVKASHVFRFIFLLLDCSYDDFAKIQSLSKEPKITRSLVFFFKLIKIIPSATFHATYFVSFKCMRHVGKYTKHYVLSFKFRGTARYILYVKTTALRPPTNMS